MKPPARIPGSSSETIHSISSGKGNTVKVLHIISWAILIVAVVMALTALWIQCQMYDHKRFMTWTGKHIIGTPATIEHRQEQLSALFEEIAPEITPAAGVIEEPVVIKAKSEQVLGPRVSNRREG
jgi:hypothetical protein